MPVYKDKGRNTWYVVINHRVNGKNKATFKRGFQTKREAVAWEKEALLENKYAHTSGTFMETLIEQTQYADLSESTAKEKIRAAEMYFDYVDKPIEKIKKQDLVKWRNDLKTNTDLLTSTKNQLIREIKSVFNYAERIYEMPNPAKALTIIKETSDDVKEMQIWSPEQFEQFATNVEHPVYRAYFTLMFWTGIRRSEAAALCKNDIDFINNTVSITKNISKSDFMQFTPLKTKSSRRIITVDSVTMELLKPLYETASPYIFGNDRPLSVSNVNRQWRTGIKKAGLPYIRIHDLRHSHASWLIGNGINIVAVSKRLGHSTIEQTLKTYTHLLESNSNELIEKIENYRKI